MDIKKLEYKNIDETLYEYEHKSGLKAFVIPKKGYQKKHATFSTHYGSINNKFVVPGELEITTVPDGIAHFLEHKLFEQKDGSVMDKFAELGSRPNAYTGFNQTVYLFSCTEKFNENFNLLLKYVQNPYLTDENVEKEKGIIEQEIKMYDDNAEWRVFFNFLSAMYKENPVRIDIPGTVESVNKINKEILYKCYNTFYHPSNMVILVVGDVDPKKVFEEVENCIKETKNIGEIKRVFPDEENTVNKVYVEQNLAVSLPIFQMGFKETKFNGKGIEALEMEICNKIILSMIMGSSSKLYNELYSENLIDRSFGYDYTIEENYAYSCFGGDSKDPNMVKNRILKEIEDVKKNGFSNEQYERIKKAMKGRAIRQLNSVEKISNMFISVYFKGVNIFDCFNIYDRITFDKINDCFEKHFNIDNMVMSVVKPI